MKQYRHIAYYRVSTKGQSLGLSAQKEMVKNYLKDKWPPLASYQEKESGKRVDNRPELIKALEHCKREKATLVVATLDRLSRDLHFLTLLQKEKTSFVVTDMPSANKLTIQLFGALAEYERECISKRTSRALQELKRKGVKLGSNNPHTLKGLKRRWKRQKAERQNKQVVTNVKTNKTLNTVKLSSCEIADQKVLPMIRTFKKQGMSFERIAEALNSSQVPSRRGGQWHKTAVHRVAKRAGL